MRRLLAPLAVLALLAGTGAAARALPAEATAPSPAGAPAGAAGGSLGGSGGGSVRIGSGTAAPVCPGPETLHAPDGAATAPPPGPVVVAGAVAGVTAGAGEAAGGPGADPAATPAPAVRAPSWRRTTAVPLALRPDRDGPGLDVQAMSSVQATLARRGDLRGLAAVACPVPATQAWLLGGGAGQGRRSRLLLTNPAPAPATVDVAVHGRTGRRAGPAARGVTLPAGGTRALLLDALAPGVDPVAVHVVARSGRFVATLHDTVLRGLVPGGTDGVGPAAPAATTQVVPGVTQGEGRVVVRILVPGGGDAVVRVGLLGTAGRIPPAREVVTVRAGTVADVPVRGIPAGSYAAVVEADVPVVAGVLVERATERAAGPADVAWASSAEPLTANVLSAVPTPALAAALAEAGDRAGPRARPAAVLVLSAPQAGRTVVVGEYAATGKRLRATRLRLPAHRTVRLGLLPTAGAVLVSAGDVPDAPLYGALELSSADPRGALLAVVPLRPPAAPPREVRALREDRRAGVP